MTGTRSTTQAPVVSWQDRLSVAALVLGISSVGHLVWEIGQLPLFTLWSTGTRGEQVFAVLHCTAGDVMITGVVLAVAITLSRAKFWPHGQWSRVIGIFLPLGLAYTAFSEWLNVYVRTSWSYAPAMPILKVGTISIGLAPLLQWVVVPLLALLTSRLVRRHADRAAK